MVVAKHKKSVNMALPKELLEDFKRWGQEEFYSTAPLFIKKVIMEYWRNRQALEKEPEALKMAKLIKLKIALDENIELIKSEIKEA